MAHHDFGIIDQFRENKMYGKYEPKKYNCIEVDMQLIDYIIENYIEKLNKIKTYASISSKPFYGLEESNITIIPPKSLKQFQDIIIDANLKIKSTQLNNLIYKIDEAIQNNSYLIHYGI